MDKAKTAAAQKDGFWKRLEDWGRSIAGLYVPQPAPLPVRTRDGAPYRRKR